MWTFMEEADVREAAQSKFFTLSPKLGNVAIFSFPQITPSLNAYTPQQDQNPNDCAMKVQNSHLSRRSLIPSWTEFRIIVLAWMSYDPRTGVVRKRRNSPVQDMHCCVSDASLRRVN